jgi:hypothetical protein
MECAPIEYSDLLLANGVYSLKPRLPSVWEVKVRETDRWIQLADGFLILAEKELSAFVRAVDKLFGAEQARQSALHWIEVLERMDWPSGESIPDWRRATVGASARLSALLSGSGEPELGKRGRRFL